MTQDVDPAITAITTVTSTSTDLSVFTPEEQARIIEVAEAIDIASYASVASFGIGIQDELKRHTLGSLKYTTTGTDQQDPMKVILEVKEALDGLKNAKNPKRTAKKIVEKVLELQELFRGSINELSVDLRLSTKTYEKTLAASRELAIYLCAGRLALRDARASPQFQKAQTSTSESASTLEALNASSFIAQCDEFERKLYNMSEALVINTTQATQAFLLCGMLREASTRLQEILDNAIPTWLRSIQIDLGIDTLKRANVILGNMRQASASYMVATDNLMQRLDEAVTAYHGVVTQAEEKGGGK